MFEHVYAVCYTGKKHRYEPLMDELARMGISDAHVVWDFPSPYKSFLLSKIPHIPDLDRKPGCWGATLTHYRAIKTAYELGQDNVLIVEDDCRFLKDAERVRQTLQNAPSGWDILLLDSFNRQGPIGEPVNGWQKFIKGRSSGCYMVNRRAMERLIDLYESPVNGKFRRPTMRVCDHWTDARFLDGLSLYCAVPNLAIQRDCLDSTNSTGFGTVSIQKFFYIPYGLDLASYAPFRQGMESSDAVKPTDIAPTPGQTFIPITQADDAIRPNPTLPEPVAKETVDILYIVGKGAEAQDNQPLRWSLRSIAKHAKNVGRIIVAGCPPAWLSDKVVKVPADVWSRGKHWNMLNGIATAVIKENLRYPLLYSSDDHYLCKDADLRYWPRFERGQLLTLAEFIKRKGRAPGTYQKSLCDTRRCLEAEGLNPRKACLHYNTWMDGRDLEEVLAIADRHREITRFGFEPTCLFNAVFEKKHPRAVYTTKTNRDDSKIHVASEIDAKIASGALGFSTSPSAETDRKVIAKMNALFPDKSPWEI